ncbi:MAG: hypothetical protein CMO55_14540 [Verrucomicrobiales bacterium]|nr:hypothetical protein [Verrucomicrobiales bacterium]
MGCLHLLFLIPLLSLGWLLSWVLDPILFRIATKKKSFDYQGRWTEGNAGFVYGQFGAIAPDGFEGPIEVTIYYSHLQHANWGKTVTRQFRPISDWKHLYVASKNGKQDSYFSYIPGEQLLWMDRNRDSPGKLEGWYGGWYPTSVGKWKVKKAPTLPSHSSNQ